MKISRIALCALALSGALVVGCGDNPPSNANNAINAITPGMVYLNRNVSVTIGGNGTAWSNTTTVDFGPGISATITAANAAVLLVDLKIADFAAIGPRDVIVNDGANGLLTLRGVFKVEPPLAVVGAQGTLAQGSIFIARAKQNDLSTPFDTVSDGAHIALTAGAGVAPESDDVQAYTIDFRTMVDVNTTPGAFNLSVASGIPGNTVTSTAPQALTIAARTPMPLVAGSQSGGTVAAPYASYLYSFTPGAHKLVTVDATAANQAAKPQFALLPESGKFADLISIGSTGHLITNTDMPIYVVYWDKSGASGYPFDLKVSSVNSDDLEPNDACAMAQPLASKSVSLANLSLRSDSDEDWFTFDAVAGDIGQLVHVTTKPGDVGTDTYVQIYTGTCANLVPLGPPSKDNHRHEDHTSAPIAAAGKVFIKISKSPTDPLTGSLYDLGVELVRTEAEPNSACVQANALPTVPVNLGFLSLSSAKDEDWFAVTVTAANVGRLLEVTTSPGEENTDTFIEVYSGSCASLTLLGTSDDSDFLDSVRAGPLPAAGTYYVRLTGSPTYPYVGAGYNVSFNFAAPNDAEPNNTCAQAGPGGALGVPLQSLSLSSATDVDWFVFPVLAADVGKVVHVETLPGNDDTDTVVEVYGGTCAALTSLGGPSDDIYAHEDWLSTPITQAGKVYVKVSYSSAGYVGAGYRLIVSYE